MFEEVTKFTDSFLEMGIPGNDCVIYKDGKEVYRHMGGYSDLENKIPTRGDERYNIYSCSKPITVTAALRLYEKGLYKLSDPLSAYMPEFKEMTVRDGETVRRAQNPITIENLFTMTAGFSYNVNSPELMRCRAETDGRCPTRKTMEYLAKEPLNFEPGTKWAYSLCHDVLAALVEVLSGEKFEDYTRRHIFEPLGMTHTTFLLPENELDTLAQHYRWDSNAKTLINCGRHNQGYKLGTEYASGGAGCISTVGDYIKFLEAVRKGDILLKNETTDLLSTNRVSGDLLAADFSYQHGYGYGLGVRCPREGSERTDFGWGGAAGSYLSINRKKGYTLFYAQHVMNSPNQLLRYRLVDLIERELA